MDTKLISNYVDSQRSRYSVDVRNNKLATFNDKSVYYQPVFIDIPESENDIYEQITDTSVRLDSIAYKYYADSKLWWIIAMVNNLNNPFVLKRNSILRIPSQSSLIKEGVIR